MPHFYHSQLNYYLTTNYKVMFSTLRNQPSLIQLDRKQENVLKLKGLSAKHKINPFQIRHYLIVRNPYDRLISFYKDKLRRQPLREDFIKKENWQDSHRLFFRLKGYNGKDNYPVERDLLTNISFKEFILLLPDIYCKDAHLHPQYWLNQIKFKGIFLGDYKFSKVGKIDDRSFISFLGSDLKLDFSKKYNANTHSKDEITIEWNPELRSIVNEIYKKDFELYNYSMLTK